MTNNNIVISWESVAVPRTTVVFFQEDDGTAPVVVWLAELRRVEPRSFAKCVVRLERLRELGHELRRPEVETLRDGIHELRPRLGHVTYRILYSMHGRVVAVLLHALVKEDVVPEADIDLAAARKNAFSRDPAGHTFRGPMP